MKSSKHETFGQRGFFNQFEALLFHLCPLRANARLAVFCIDLLKIDDGPVIKQGGFVYYKFLSYHPLPCYIKKSESYFTAWIALKLVLALEKENLV